MEKLYSAVSGAFDWVVQFGILLIEFIGVCVLFYTVGRAIVGLVKRHDRVRLSLAEGIALSLEFKMGGELLRTVVVREWKELLILGAVILLRAALTFLIQWEIRIEKKNHAATPVCPKEEGDMQVTLLAGQEDETGKL